jgi:hypothetical protein
LGVFVLRVFAAFLFFVACLTTPTVAFAQNTGGVFPPSFGPDHKSAQYRVALNTETDRFAQRLHFQQSLDERRVWRVVGQTRETSSSDFDFDYIQAELFWEIGKLDSKYRTGLRFDARLRDDNRPGQIGINWMHQWQLEDGWRARLVGLSA